MGRQRLLKLMSAVAVVTSAVVGAPAGTHAVTYGEPLIDCTREGDEYLFDFTPGDGTVSAWVTDDDGTVVSQADVEPLLGLWEVLVPANTSYSTVWISDGTSEVSVPAESRDCSGTTVSIETDDFGPGLTTISPQRLYDTRTSNDRLAPGATLEVQAGGRAGVPANATAVMVNVAAVNPASAGFLTAYPCDEPMPTAAAVTYVARETRAGASLVELGATGTLCIYSPSASHVVVDVQGYVADSENPVAITPTRVLDTRTDDSPIDGERIVSFGDMSSLDLPFDPGTRAEEVAGLWLNVSAVRAEAPGYLSVYDLLATGNSTTSRLNYEVGRAQTNLVYTPVDGGTIKIVTSSKTHVTVDVVAVSRHPNAMVPSSDFRLLDTRRGPNNTTTDGRLQGTGPLQPNVERRVLIGGRLGPNYPTSVLLNVAIVKPTATTHVTVYPCGTTPPTVSSANAARGKVVPNAVLVPVGEGNSVCIVSPVETDVVIDLEATMTTQPFGTYYSTCLTTNPMQGNIIAGGAPPYTITGTLPEGISAEYRGGKIYLDQADDTSYVFDGQLLVTDSAGKTVSFHAFLHWAISYPPNPPC